MKLDPENHIMLNNLGCVYLELGELKKALKCINKALKINADFSHTWHSLGEYHEITGNKEKAHECYQKAVDLDPENQEHKEALRNIQKKD
jgi:tetratricopeptide (TPR) repeat protein